MLTAKNYTLEQAAKYFKVSSRTLIRWLAKEDVKWSDLKPIDDTSDTHVTLHDTRLGDVKPSPGKSPPPHAAPSLATPSSGDDGSLKTPGAPLFSPKLQKIINLAPALKDIPSWLGPTVLRELEKDEIIKDDMVYLDLDPRHHLLYTDCKQRDLYLWSMHNSSATAGVRGTSKTYTLEDVFKKKSGLAYIKRSTYFLRIFSGTQDTAKQRVIALGRLLHKAGIPKKAFIKDGAEMVQLGNESEVWVEITGHALTPSNISSWRANDIWIDEGQFIPREIFDVLLPLFSGKQDTCLYISGNALESDDSAFETIMTDEDPEFRKAMFEMFRLRYFWFEESDIYWTSDKEKQSLRMVLEKMGTENAVAKEMTNEFVRATGSYYPITSIKTAFALPEHPRPEIVQFDRIICGIDWGDEHDCSFIVGGRLDHQCYLLHLTRFQHPTTDQLILEMIHIVNTFPGVEFAWETSPLGSFVRNDMRKYYPEFRYLDSSFTKRKQKFIDNVYVWLVDEDLFLYHENYLNLCTRLKSQLKSFKNDKKNDDFHDALAHLLYHIDTPRTSVKTTMSVVVEEEDY